MFNVYQKSNGGDDNKIDIQFRRSLIHYEKLNGLNTGHPVEKEIEKVKWGLDDMITCLHNIKGAGKLEILIKKAGNDWFTVLYCPGVPLHNNQVEREIRSVILLRKTISHIINCKGQRWTDIVMFVIHTWKLQEQ